ncbi:MAG: thioesterase [Lachnospiraceae bacterium]|nr:thioesterase [Lachnospiraceae bacterium]
MILILPCAGGSASNFNKYKKYSNDFYIYEYSGHWSRYEEQLETSIEQSVRSLKKDIINSNVKEITLFGHSMGGLIAWNLANEVLKEGVNVKQLYIAACCPLEVKPDFLESICDDLDIKVLLHNIRQVQDKVLKSAFFNEDLLPIIKNDFSMVKRFINEYNPEDNTPLSVPITCLYGEDDPVIKPVEMELWRKYTSAEFRCISFPGNHFFLYEKDNVKGIADILLGNK